MKDRIITVAMQLIELSEYRDEEGLITFENRVRGTIKWGFSWYGDMEAQEFVTRQLQNVLNDDHLLLLNAPVVGAELLAPMILFSPQGARLIYPSTARGTFRAIGDDWQSFGGRSRKFTPTRPNIQFRALAFARGLLRYFESQGFPLPEMEAVLVFVNPQTHVDSANPQARIVLADAIEHFASKLLELPVIMDQDDIHMLVDAMLNPKLPKPEPQLESAENLGPGIFESQPLRPLDERSDLSPQPRYRGFTRRQLIVLAVLGVFQLALMLAIAFIIFGESLLN